MIKELDGLNDDELLIKLRHCSPLELDNISVACWKADPGGSTGSDGGIHIARTNATRAGMNLLDFQEAIGRIEGAISQIQDGRAQS